MDTEEEASLCATVLVARGLLFGSNDPDSEENDPDQDPEAYACAAVLVAGNMMLNSVERPKR